MEVTWRDLSAGAAGIEFDPGGKLRQPLALIDLDAEGRPPDALRTTQEIGRLVVGVTNSEPSPEALPHLTCWVSPGAAEAIETTVRRCPVASIMLAQLLRLAPASVAEALALESLAYSSLLSGAEFASWLTAHRQAPAARTADPVLVDRRADVLTLTLNRPSRHNAYSAGMRDALREALDVADADPDVTVVLRGAGGSFCSGGDLAEFGLAQDPALAHLVRMTAGAAPALHRLRDRTRAEIHGACIGAGIELAAFCGRVEATCDATFSLPELAMGLIPGAGGTVSLPRRIGRWRTAELALTGNAIDVDTALKWGLVDARIN